MNLRYILPALVLIFMASCSNNTYVEDMSIYQGEIKSSNLTIELSENEELLFNMVNDYRKQNGLNELTFNFDAYEFALAHNNYMMSVGKLSHDNFDERAANIAKVTTANFIAENVAKDFRTLEGALQGWLDSAPHKNTIEGDYTHATLCITTDSDGNPYYTQIFFRK